MVNLIASNATVTGYWGHHPLAGDDQPGYLEGYGVIDAELGPRASWGVRELADTAALRMVECPTVSPAEALRYQPSAALARWIRYRDVTCRFPGCDRPASICDIDHTTPFNHANPAAGGLTVPHNLACYCRDHHRLKTFHSWPNGWQNKQLPDGTIVWISPTGRTYCTKPGGAELFPQLRPACVAPKPHKRSRSRERAARITRARNSLREQRPLNAEQRHINRARRQEIADRKWRNHMRKMLIIFNGNEPSTSPWCTPPQAGGAPRVNDPFELEELPLDWSPPPSPSPPDQDDPPF